MSELNTACEAHPEMHPVDVARVLLARHPDEQTRKAFLVVVDLLEALGAKSIAEHIETIAPPADAPPMGPAPTLIDEHPLDTLAKGGA